MIDAASGTLAFDRGAVTPGLARRAFLGSPLARKAELVVENGRLRTYQLASPLTLDGRAVAAMLSFSGETLSSVSLSLDAARFGTSWDDWSEAKERARMRAHTKWLCGVLDGDGPCWKLPWGEVESSFDPKGGGSSIEIFFARRARRPGRKRR